MSLSVLVIDDDILYRQLISSAFTKSFPNSHIETAPDAFKALELIKHNYFDVIIVDFNMPVLNGIDAIKRIKDLDSDTNVILASATKIKIEDEEKAIADGVYAFLPKPHRESKEENFDLLVSLLGKICSEIQHRDLGQKTSSSISVKKAIKKDIQSDNDEIEMKNLSELDLNYLVDYKIVTIAISTGGPKVLEKVFNELHVKKQIKPLLIIQHMPSGFTSFFVDSLKKRHDLEFCETDHNMEIENKVYIARGGSHTTIKKAKDSYIFKLNDGPLVKGLRPAADIAFKSIADSYAGEHVLSIVMTGLGDDGTDGVEVMLKECRLTSVVQSPAEAIADGMPSSIVKHKLAHYKGRIYQIIDLLNEVLNNESKLI